MVSGEGTWLILYPVLLLLYMVGYISMLKAAYPDGVIVV